MHIIVSFISTDGNTRSLTRTQQDCKEEKCSKKSCGFCSFIVNNLLISSSQRRKRQAKEITIPSGGMEGIINKIPKTWKNFELSRKTH